ncbi:CoA-dependent acyltransferase [Peniophora sp. CONT]|nr:CoA-dependent acyltransferase [Peniophora sp. CONT]
MLLRCGSRSLLYRSHPRLLHTTSILQARKVLQKFKLADIGEGITECEVIKWNVALNRTVAQFDPLCEVQSDKASVEITSPYDGILKELLVKEGQVARVGEALCIIEVDDEAAEQAGSSVTEPVEADAARPPPTPVDKRETDVIENARPTLEDLSEAIPSAQRRTPHPLDPNAQAASIDTSSDVLALPSVRHFARQSGVNISLLAPGSGKNGRIERSDVERYLAGQKEAPASASASAQPSSKEDVVIELGRTRYGMWKAMTKSLEIPHFGYTTYLDLTALDALLPALNQVIPAHYLPSSSSPARPPLVSPSAFAAPSPPPEVPEHARYNKLTYLPVLLKTLSLAMTEWPLLRSSITPGWEGKPTMTLRPHADIAIALSTPTGLYTPVLQRVDQQPVYALASEIRRIAHLGRQIPSALTPSDMPKRGATLTVSNVGAVGKGTGAAPVLVPGGGVAIVALGRARWEMDYDEHDGEKRLILPISWAADHRVVEGAELAAFVETWRGWVENPTRMIGSGI